MSVEFCWLFEDASTLSTLERRIKENPLDIYSLTLEPTPEWNKIVITGFEPCLIEDVEKHRENGSLSLYFESKTFCPLGGEVASVSVLPCQHAVIIEFIDPAVVKRLPEKHKIPDCSEAESRPFGYFEYVEGPDCIACKQSEVTVRDDDDDKESDRCGAETDVKRNSMHDSHDENSCSEDNPASETTCNDDSENGDLEKLNTWSSSNTAEHSPTLHRKETASGSSSQNLPGDKRFYTASPEKISLLCKTIKCKKMPNWNPELYKKVKLVKDKIEICCPGQEDQIRIALDDANTFGEVDLADYTMVADKLNCRDGIKWIEQLLDDLQHPVQVAKHKSSIKLQALNLDLAEDAARTIERSLLPAQVKCNRPSQMAKFVKIVQDKYILIAEENRKTDNLKLLGIPKDVIEAVRSIEKHL